MKLMEIARIILICIFFSCAPVKDIATHSTGKYPSPFSPSTNHFLFSLDNEDDVLVLLYNMEGKLLDTLVNGVLKKGTNTIYFDPSPYPSGVYTYKYVGRDTTFFKKITLIK